jgi:hypothetical protein
MFYFLKSDLINFSVFCALVRFTLGVLTLRPNGWNGLTFIEPFY